MKKQLSIIVLIIFFIGKSAFSQVLIGDPGGDPEVADGALLELRSDNLGLLLPRTTITDANSAGPIAFPTDGLLIYNLGADGVAEGFYYWDNNKWNHLSNENSTINVNQISDLYETAELYENQTFNTPSHYDLDIAYQQYGWTTAVGGEKYGDTDYNLDDPTADCIIAGEDGLYEVDVTISFGGTNNAQVTGTVFHSEYISEGVWGPAIETRIRYMVKLKSYGDMEGSTAHGLIMLKAGDKIDLRFMATSINEDLNIYNVSFIANRVGQYSEPTP